MSRAVDLPVAARVALAGGVVHLDPESAACSVLKEGGTIQPRLDLVRPLARFTNQYPWQWDPAVASTCPSPQGSPGELRA